MNVEVRLGHYQSVLATPGFPPAIASVIAELRLGQIPPNAIAASAPHLAPLLEAYQLELKEAGLTDWAGVLAFANEAASAVNGERLRLVGLPILLLDVPIGNEAELSFIHSLAVATPEVSATAPTSRHFACLCLFGCLFQRGGIACFEQERLLDCKAAGHLSMQRSWHSFRPPNANIFRTCCLIRGPPLQPFSCGFSSGAGMV
jgi:hypothetical protein